MLNKMTIQERYYIFVSLCLVGMVWYQSYYTYRTDAIIDEAINKNNQQIQRYSEITREITLENIGLKHDLIHSQAMYQASTNHCEMLEKEIKALGEYWKKEYTKVSDELFDLKHSRKKQ
tara:strand:- start:1516 stop:1872 length:357 start_codon:yes stop_codon:yes gene_type:complete